jgi:hypothetical protein
MDGVLAMVVVVLLQNQVSVLSASLAHHVKKVLRVVAIKATAVVMHVAAN